MGGKTLCCMGTEDIHGQVWYHGQTSGIPLIHIFRPQRSKSWEKFKHSWDLRNRAISKEASYSCRCSTDVEHWIKDNQQKCVTNATDVTGIREAIQVRSLVFLVDTEQETAWYRTCPNKPNGAWDHVAAFLGLEISSPRKASRPSTFRVRLKWRKLLFALFWQASSCAFTPQCVFGLISHNRNKEACHRGGLWLTTNNVTNLTHRKDLRQSHCSIVTRGRFLSREMGTDTRRVFHHLAAIQIQKWCVLWRIMRVQVQSWLQRQWTCQDDIRLKSWYHPNRMSTLILGYSSAEVQSTRISPCEEDSHSRVRSCASNELTDKILQVRKDSLPRQTLRDSTQSTTTK